MIRRISKTSSLDLIKQIKKVEISACQFNPRSKSVFELMKQLQSKRFTEFNPKYECVFENMDDENAAPSLKVEFSNSMKWEIDPSDYTAQRLREAIFTKAHDVEILETISNAEKPEDL
jgi:hypothetical protein